MMITKRTGISDAFTFFEKGYVIENRALSHLRSAAELRNLDAREVIDEYVVNVSSPPKLSFTKDEVQVLLRNMRSEYS